MHIALDPGSCHQGKLDYAYELILFASEVGADSIKFQLFGDEYAKNGNVVLPLDWVGPLMNHGEKIGIPVAFSVFDQKSLEHVLNFKVPYIKFAWSQRHKVDTLKAICNRGIKCIVSASASDVHLLPDHPCLKKLICWPEYPKMEIVSWEGLFPKLFDGLSDHFIGYGQAVDAVKTGAEWIEKHIKLDYADVTCPDAVLPHSLNKREAREYINELRKTKAWVNEVLDVGDLA